jgi:hypothetical protein
MSSDLFKLSLSTGFEALPGIIQMADGKTFEIILDNWSDRNVDCELSLNGESSGVYRIKPLSRIILERPSTDIRRFTFLKQNTEGERPLKDYTGENYRDRGVIEAVFKPEIKSPHFMVLFAARANRYLAGEIGFSEESDQEFDEVSPLITDPNDHVVKRLRLATRV